MFAPLQRRSLTAAHMALKRTFRTSTAVLEHYEEGNFVRPAAAPSSTLPRATRKTSIAMPHTPPDVPDTQSPNYPKTWSADQNPRDLAMRGPRFEQMTPELQPQPLSAMEMISREPIRLTEKRIIECDGGDGPLGHPRVFINLDKPGPKGCPYWYVLSLISLCFRLRSFQVDYGMKDHINTIDVRVITVQRFECIDFVGK